LQQVWPALPQATQVFTVVLHVVLDIVQSFVGQQGWLRPPQLPHVPALHSAPFVEQAVPGATHVPFTQQPPPVQVLPAQQV
jgi:hypothetical protein